MQESHGCRFPADARVSLIQPLLGWSQLMVPYGETCRLLASWNVFPEFYRYLSAFGFKQFAKDEAFAGYDCRETHDAEGNPTGIGE